MKRYIVTGIDTNAGKTVVSAILTELLQADYWKPVQAGDLDNSDSINVKNLISNNKSIIHDESYRLNSPLSPHAAAIKDNINIEKSKIKRPETNNSLIIEGAGGVMVPLADGFLMIDLFEMLGGEIVLVSKNYLGSINHTLLTIEALQKRNLSIAGIIFNGVPNPDSENFILKHTGLRCLGNIPLIEKITKEFIKTSTQLIKL